MLYLACGFEKADVVVKESFILYSDNILIKTYKYKIILPKRVFTLTGVVCGTPKAKVKAASTCNLVEKVKRQFLFKEPLVLNYGVISRDKTLSVRYQYFGPEVPTVTEIVAPEFLGVTVDNPLLGDDVIIGYNIITVTAELYRGHLDVDSFLRIILSNGQELKIFIKIQRRVLPSILLIPDKGTYQENLEFKTNKFIAQNNALTTTPLMQEGKYSCTYEVTLHERQLYNVFENLLQDSRYRVISHPLWAQATILEQEMTSSHFIHCNTIYSDFRVDDDVLVYISVDFYYYAKIVNLYDNGMEINGRITAPVGAYVVPTFPAMINGSVSMRYSNARMATGSVEFIEFREGSYHVLQ